MWIPSRLVSEIPNQKSVRWEKADSNEVRGGNHRYDFSFTWEFVLSYRHSDGMLKFWSGVSVTEWDIVLNGKRQRQYFDFFQSFFYLIQPKFW